MSDTDPDAAHEGEDVDKPDQPEKDWEAEANKWKALARKHEGTSKANAGAAKELAELKDADKSELQRATDKVTDAEKGRASAEAKLSRLEVALDKAPEGMPLSKVRKLAGRLTGDSREDLEADAAELFADFAPSDTDDSPEGDDTPSRRPQVRLKPGAAPDAEPEETDPDKLAALVPRI